MNLFHKHNHTQSIATILPDESGESARTIRKVVTIGCLVNLLLMCLKLCVGWFGHSEALFADGFHSLNDVAADIIMLVFIGISFRQADKRYTYGYGKFETLSSFLMSSFLIIVAILIAREGIETIIDYTKGEQLERPDIWTFIVVLFAMACKECLFRYYSATGKNTGSKALVANAWHHRSDALASVATLIGVTAAHFFGDRLSILDPLASILIALFILTAAIRMLVPAFNELMEHSIPENEAEKARKTISETEGVMALKNLRCRRNGHFFIFDATVAIDSNLDISQGYSIVENIERNLKKNFCKHIILSVTTIPN